MDSIYGGAPDGRQDLSISFERPEQAQLVPFIVVRGKGS